MIPYPGESLGAFDAANGTDHSLAVDVIYRGSFYGTTSGSATLTAGDTWRAWVASGTADYLEEDGLDLDVSWVVEVVSGTVTFTAGEANDPDYGNDALAPSSTLGTYTVTGPATVVIPSGFTGTQVYNAASDDICFMLHLAATSGSAVVQQVKLRAWPQGGALGGWVDQPGFNTTPVAPTFRTASVSVSGGSTAVSGAEASWDAMIDDFHANATTGLASTSRTLGTGLGTLTAGQTMTNDGGGTYSSSTIVGSALTLITGQDWASEFAIADTLTDGVDYIRPPEEVAGDITYYAQQLGTGSTGWENASLYLVTTGTMPGSYTFAAEAGVWPDESGTAGYQITAGITVGTSSVGQNGLPTSSQMILVSVSHSALAGDADAWPGWSPGILDPSSNSDEATRYFGDHATTTPIKTYAVMPAYRVWNPTAQPEQPLKLITRSDSLGMGAGRLFGTDTRQRSIRLLASP